MEHGLRELSDIILMVIDYYCIYFALILKNRRSSITAADSHLILLHEIISLPNNDYYSILC